MDMVSKRIKGADEENTAFALPVKTMDQSADFEGDIVNQDPKMGNNLRRRPRQK